VWAVLFLGNDWAEAHHDIELVDESGRRLARRRLPEGVDGLSTLHGLIADHLDEADEPDQVVVGIETDRGPWVQALIAAGYTVYAINPRQVARTGSGTAPPAPRAILVTRTCWPSWSASTERTTGRWPGTRRSPSTSRCSPGPISR
jgi:hypothetical protein